MYHPPNCFYKKFDPYDMDRLEEARRLLQAVHDYNYDYPPTRRMNNRLATIIQKLDELLNLNKADP